MRNFAGFCRCDIVVDNWLRQLLPIAIQKYKTDCWGCNDGAALYQLQVDHKSHANIILHRIKGSLRQTKIALLQPQNRRLIGCYLKSGSDKFYWVKV